VTPKLKPGAGHSTPRGASVVAGGVNFSVFSEEASEVQVCLFDENGSETGRFALDGREGPVHFGQIEGIGVGTRYGLRADGPYDPARGLWFDPEKLLVDPYARRIDGPFVSEGALSAPREQSVDTAGLVPKALVSAPEGTPRTPLKLQPELIYEVNVRGFSKLRPDVPEGERGRLSALMSEGIAGHLKRIGVNVLQLMPVAAWIDDGHLSGLGLNNVWGYNPVTLMAPDPRLMPHGIGELRELTDFYRRHEIAVILDVVFNHTGEGNARGPVLSHRGLDALSYYRHIEVNGTLFLVNDMGTGNTLRCDNEEVRRLVLEAMRTWVSEGGVSGFRFDLAPALGRSASGFHANAPLIKAIRSDPLLRQCLMMAEPWDPGPGGYQLGNFPGFYEHNDRFRDDVRAFWRGDQNMLGALAARISGSADIFSRDGRTAHDSVNFIAVHDGFTLRDTVSYADKHNEANGEENRDGHDHNLSWNCGAEGDTEDAGIIAKRKTDARALLATLMLSRGTPLLQQGDEFWRTQKGNNNAYAQDNEITWVDWAHADEALIAFFAKLNGFRRKHKGLTGGAFLAGHTGDRVPGVSWLHPDRRNMSDADWHDIDGSVLGMYLNGPGDELIVWVNRWIRSVNVHCPLPDSGHRWVPGVVSSGQLGIGVDPGHFLLPERSVVALVPGD